MKKLLILCVAMYAISCGGLCYGVVIASHSGLADPATGLGLYANGDTSMGSPVADDLGTGIDAWSITEVEGTEILMYVHDYTTQELADIAANGYTMTANMRITTLDMTLGNDTVVLYSRANDKRFVLWFSTDSSGVPTVVVHPKTESSFTMADAGYHEYKLVVGADEVADLFVDGVEVISDIPGDHDVGPQYGQFGNSHDKPGDAGFGANYNLFEIVIHDPSTSTPGDANGDGYVDVSDLGILATHYDSGGGKTWEEADFTGDGFVDVSDLGILATNYGTTPQAAVPEPGMAALLTGLAALALFIRRRRN